MMSELSYEASDEASENELLERSLSVWRGWSSIREDFTPIPLDIHTASSIGQYECVRTLIARGEVEIDRKNIGGWTPLMYACYIGHDHIVNLLIDAGCNVNLKNQRGQTPLMLAASCGNESVGRTLLRKGAELEAADRNGWTALFHATYSGHQNFVSFLLDQRSNMDAVEPSTGMTPFMEAAVEGHEIIVQLFLQHGVHVNAKAYNGDTARSLALMYGYMKIVSLIDNHVMPHSTLRSEPGLEDYLSSSDEVDRRQRPQHQRSSRAKSKGPSIRDGPEAIARMIDRTRASDHVRYPHLVVPRGYVTFPHGEGERADTLLSYRDVTSPINQEDYRLDSSGGKDSCDYNDDSNAFSKTGAITIKSSSSSSGGLIAALGLSRQNSADSEEFVLHDSGVHNSSQSEDNVSARPRPRNPGHAGGDVAHVEDGSSIRQDTEAPCVDTAVDAGQKCNTGSEGQEEQDGESRISSCSSQPEHTADTRGNSCGKPVAQGAESDVSNLTLSSGVDNTDKESEDVSVVSKGKETECHIQFGGVVLPDVLEDSTGGDPAAVNVSVDSNARSLAAVSKQPQCDTVIPGRNPMPDSSLPPAGLSSGPTLPPVSHDTVRCLPYPEKPPGKHLQRRSSCQARLSRLSVAERDNLSQTSETRHRRRSANSPPTFHREFSGRGQDAGHGTGRVSCLSDIPSSAGPLAGYPVTTATPVIPGPQFPVTDRREDAGDDGDRRFTGFHQHQIPIAAVAPTCVPPNFPSVSHTATAVSTPLPPQSPRKNSAPEVTPAAGPVPVSSPVPVGHDGHQSDTATVCHTDEAPPRSQSSLSALVRELPGGGGGGAGGRGECDLAALLDQLGLSKYTAVFVEQDVDLQVFLSLTDNDLKEIGIKLFGPRKKMTNAIARWHSQAPAARSSLEQAYADRLEGEMQEMAIQLNQMYDNVEKLRAQVLQERQLRSVTESCLMEERGAWQRTHHTLIDAHHRLRDLTDTLTKLSSCHSELKKRIGKPQNHAHTHTTPSVDSELHTLSVDQVTELCERYLYDLHQNCATLAHHMEHVVSSPPATGGIHDTRDVENDFP